MRDVRERHLTAALESAYEHVQKFNSYEAIAGRLKYIYEQARLNAVAEAPGAGGGAVPRRPAGDPCSAGGRPPRRPTDRAQHQAQIVRRVARKKALTFALWNDFKPPPYGGGNQFLIALEGALQRKGMRVVRNSGRGRGCARRSIHLVRPGPVPAGARARLGGPPPDRRADPAVPGQRRPERRPLLRDQPRAGRHHRHAERLEHEQDLRPGLSARPARPDVDQLRSH